MKAKNVSKNVGKEVIINARTLTHSGGKPVPKGTHVWFPLGTVLKLLRDIDDDGDVLCISTNSAIPIYVHHKFIKLAHKESK